MNWLGNRLIAENFQIINGAQTVTSLSRVEPSSDVEVLFRLTKTLDVKTEKGINEKIIRFNNSQNAIKLSDFRSNDLIQVFLERNLISKRTQGPLPKLSYVRKRGSARRGRDTGASVRLEELAKIRYAFLPRANVGLIQSPFSVDLARRRGRLRKSLRRRRSTERCVALRCG